MEEQLAALDRQRDELVKKIAMKNTWATQGGVEALREELTKLIQDRTPAQTTYTDKGLAMTDLSVHGTAPWDDKRTYGPVTKPSQDEKVPLSKWSEFPA